MRITPPRTSYLPLVLLLFALLIRGGMLLAMPGSLAGDPDGYRALAENLLQHGTYGYRETPTAYRPSLYPLLLAGCVAFDPGGRAAIGALHLAMGLATVWLTFLLGRRWAMSDRAAAAAAVLVACDPILLMHSTMVMTETAATLLAVAALMCLTLAGQEPSIRRSALAGAMLALAVLCRPGFIVWLAVAGLVLPFFAPSKRAKLIVFGSFFAAATVVLSPWGVRNESHFGQPLITTTHGGYTLLLGNNPSFYDYLRNGAWGSVWNANRFNQSWAVSKPDDEISADRLAYDEALRNIAERPGMFCHACAVRIGRLWQFVPYRVVDREGPLRRLARWSVGVWYLAVLSLSAIGALSMFWQRRSPEWIWGLLLIGCLMAVHTVYWTNMRMRAPLMPVLALEAVAFTGRWTRGRLGKVEPVKSSS